MINASARFKRNAKAPVKTVQMRMTQVVSEGETPIVYSSADLIRSIKVEASSTWLYSGAKKATVVLVDELPFYANYEWVVELGIVDPASGEIDYITLGTFTTVTDDVNYEKGTTTLGLYDFMQKAEKDWHDNSHVGYPKTVEALATGIATNVGCAGLSSMTGLPNINQTVQEDLWALISQEKYRDVINEIANITGSTAIVDSNNLLKFVPFSSPIDELTYSNLKKYKLGLPYGPINSVVLSRQPQNDDVALSDNVSITENGLTEAKIVNNEIADDDRPTFIQPLFNALNGTAFDGIEMETEGHGWYEIGDAIVVGEEAESVLPSEYQRVEYLVGVYGGYIDLGIKMPNTYSYEVEFEQTESHSAIQCLFSSRNTHTQGNCAYADFLLFDTLRIRHDTVAGASAYTSPVLSFGERHKIAVKNRNYYIDGSLVFTDTSTDVFTPNYNAALLATKDANIANYATNKVRLYSAKINDDFGEPVRSLVPCYRKSDNKPGMYDLVNGVFYTNAGSGEFAVGQDMPDLPYEYQQVEYLEATGTQCIDTEHYPVSGDLLTAKIEFTSLGNQSFYGAQNTNTFSNAVGLSGASIWEYYSGTRWRNAGSVGPSVGTVYDIVYSHASGAQSLSVNGSVVLQSSDVITQTAHIATAGLFGRNSGSAISQRCHMKLYSAKITNGNKVIRNFVPVIRRSDGVAGLYDLAEGKFYTNAGTGSFITGEPVNKTTVVTDILLNLDGGGFKETIKCVTPDLTSTDYTATGGIKKSIYNTEIKTDRQQQEITSIVSRQDSFEDQVNEEFTQVYQNIAGLTVSVQTTGGGNYIKNSVGYSKDSDNNLVNWEFAGSGNYSSQTSPESMQAGAISGNQISLFNGTLTQRITLAPNIEYTLSYIGKKSVTGVAGVIIRNDNGQFNVLMPDQTAVYWEKQEITFTPTLGYVDVIITADADVTEFAITDIMLSQGDLSTPWRQADGEILNTQVAVDTEGVRVKSSVYEGDETVMTPLEFAGYSSVSGSKEKVFSLNRDTTEVQKISIQQQMSMPPLKVIPLDSPSGWAFVKEGN